GARLPVDGQILRLGPYCFSLRLDVPPGAPLCASVCGGGCGVASGEGVRPYGKRQPGLAPRNHYRPVRDRVATRPRHRHYVSEPWASGGDGPGAIAPTPFEFLPRKGLRLHPLPTQAAARVQTNLASSVMSALRPFETGQFCSASLAIRAKVD